MLPEELERRLPDKSRILLEKPDWDPAIFWTNEKPPPRSVLDRVRTKYDPAYLIGIGSANLWSHLPAFSESEPRGVISVDASKLVVSGLRLLREFLKLYPNRKEFLIGVRNFLNGEIPPIYSSTMDDLRPYFEYFANWKGYPKPRDDRINYDPLYGPGLALRDPDSRRVELVDNPSGGPDIQGFILQNYGIFRKLAVEGRMGVIRRDFRDKKFLEQVPNLDQYGARNHVVYLSNAFYSRNFKWSSEFDREAIRPVGGSLIYSLLGSAWELEMYVEDETGSIGRLSE